MNIVYILAYLNRIILQINIYTFEFRFSNLRIKKIKKYNQESKLTLNTSNSLILNFTRPLVNFNLFLIIFLFPFKL